MVDKNIAKNPPVLTTLHLWVMTIATCLVVANLYYNQPLLGVIASDFKITGAKAGLISMLTQIGYAVGMFFIIPLGDMLKRKKLIMAAFGVMILALVFTAYSPNINILMFASFLIGCSSVVVQWLVPMAAQLAPADKRGKTVGFIMSGLLIGVLLSRTISGYVGAAFGWRVMFIIAAVAMLILWIVLYFLLPEVYPDFKESYKKLMFSLVHLVKEEPLLRLASIRGSLCYACFGAFWTTLVLLLREPPLNKGSAVAGAFGLVGAVGALGASAMGRLSDKGSAHNITTGSIALVVLSFIIFGVFSTSMVGLVAGVILFDLGIQATHISNQTLIFSLRPEARNRLNTVYMVTYFIGGAFGTFLATQVWNSYKWNGVVAIGLILSSLALLIHIWFIKRLKAA